MTQNLGHKKSSNRDRRGVLNLLSVPRRFTNIREYSRVPLKRNNTGTSQEKLKLNLFISFFFIVFYGIFSQIFYNL